MFIRLFSELAKFNYIKFKEDNHTYLYNGDADVFPISVTGKVHEYIEEFDADLWAGKTAEKRGITVEEVHREWDENREKACTKGTLFHKYAENKLNNKYENLDVSPKLTDMFDEFYRLSIDNLIPIKSEIVIGDIELQIAGMIDQLYWSNKLDGLVIFDWKTNKKLRRDNRYKKMLTLFNDLDDCEYNIYSIQLNVYRYIVERNTNLKIKAAYIAWFNENNDKVEIIKCANMQHRVREMF